MKEDKIKKFIEKILHAAPIKKSDKMNGWVKLAELSNGVSICRHIKKDYIAHFFLN